MQLVFQYIELPDKEKRIVIAKDEKKAKASLVRRKVKFTNLSLDLIKTIQLNLSGKIFSDKDYIEILKIIKRYAENGRGLLEALKVAMLKPEQSTSMLASLMYEEAVQGKSLSEILKSAKMPDYVVQAIENAEKANLNVAEILGNAIEFMQTENEVKKKIGKIANSFKINLILALTSLFLVMTIAVSKLYEYGLEVKPNRKLSTILQLIVDISYFLNEHKIIAGIIYLLSVGAIFYIISGKRVYNLISKLPKVNVIEAVDKRLIASYVYLIVSSTTISTVEALKMLKNVPKLEKFRKKLNTAYTKLKGKPHSDWYTAFKIADIDKLFTAKLKTAQENIVEELKMLISDFDEIIEEQFEKTQAVLKFITTMIMIGIAFALAYIVITFTYPS